ETARPLLTPGEVMQLPPADELVLVSGLPPIRAKKLRYYEDRNFTTRVSPVPELADDGYRDRPEPRPDDWSGQVRGLHERLAAAIDEEAGAIDDEGGVQRQRHPGISEEDISKPNVPEHASALALDDETDVAADQSVVDRLRGLSPLGSAHAMNEAEPHRDPGRDLLPDF
ncbi:MAG: type IV secretory system conjugative DNA transfer family protein, partial [Alphaproteobacteria bacterium]|nr:type IV secretory system conjugative DNA transfer family protein [Alphaproteobacteria bacterium]